ncbi:MAG: ATP-binding protein [Bacteroidetes bacterium]|nr:ATP-binding protein [Bacteroidota bacterium]
MKIIKRHLQDIISDKLIPGKVCLLFGTRRVGKTFLIKEVEKEFSSKTLFLNGDDYTTLAMLEERSASNYRKIFENIDLAIIDEAQNIPEIGFKLKLMVDELPGLRILATGSSSFDLLNISGEPLTGRSFNYHLYPFAQCEMSVLENSLQTMENLEERLIFGSYPETINFQTTGEKKEFLLNLVQSYLLKDILSLNGIRNSVKMHDILKMLAFQVGKEVSVSELGNKVGLSKNTVEKYMDLLSKVFIIYPLKAFCRNPRKEIAKSSKWYFTDTGVRNAVISAFSPLNLRNDTGELWENYVISERIRFNAYRKKNILHYFWRTYDMQEIDLIEDNEGKIAAYEIKWKEKTVRCPGFFNKAYPDAEFNVINRNNYTEFITFA